MDNNIFMHTPHTIIMIDTINHYFKILIFSPYFHIHISSIVSRILFIVFVIWVQVLWFHLAVVFSKFILMYNAQSPFFLFRPLVCLRNQTLVLYNLLHLGLTKGFLVVSPLTCPVSPAPSASLISQVLFILQGLGRQPSRGRDVRKYHQVNHLNCLPGKCSL